MNPTFSILIAVPRSILLGCAMIAIAISPTLAFAQKTADPPKTKTTVTQEQEKTVPVFKDGSAQIVDGFKNRKDWIRHDLFVETEFDSDDDGKKDRMHVSVARPKQTKTEGLKVPVIYVTSPYFCGVGGTNKEYFWDPKQELGDEPPKRTVIPPFKARTNRPIISESHVGQWVPRGFAVVSFLLAGHRTVTRLSHGRWQKRIIGTEGRHRLAERSSKRLHGSQGRRRSQSRLVHWKRWDDGNVL